MSDKEAARVKDLEVKVRKPFPLLDDKGNVAELKRQFSDLDEEQVGDAYAAAKGVVDAEACLPFSRQRLYFFEAERMLRGYRNKEAQK